MSWATFWPIFINSYMVTLSVSDSQRRCSVLTAFSSSSLSVRYHENCSLWQGNGKNDLEIKNVTKYLRRVCHLKTTLSGRKDSSKRLKTLLKKVVSADPGPPRGNSHPTPHSYLAPEHCFYARSVLSICQLSSGRTYATGVFVKKSLTKTFSSKP
jgi:hypothetical protein